MYSGCGKGIRQTGRVMSNVRKQAVCHNVSCRRDGKYPATDGKWAKGGGYQALGRKKTGKTPIPRQKTHAPKAIQYFRQVQ
jgi:hypothetical protein